MLCLHQFAHDFAPGFTPALATWLRQLEWPAVCREADPGVACVEFYLSFQYYTGLRPPVNVVPLAPKHPHYFRINSDHRARLASRSLEQELRVFELALSYILKVFGPILIPGAWKQWVGALNVMGDSMEAGLDFAIVADAPDWKRYYKLLPNKLR